MTSVLDSPELALLKRIHFKLVSYYTFLSTRKHIITTFDLFKEHIAKTLDHDLTFDDVAKLKAIIPNNLKFEYVDKNNYILDEKHFSWNTGSKQKETDIFDLDKNDPDAIHNNMILVIEFIDNAPKNATITTESIKKLIVKRDNRFLKELKNFVSLHKEHTIAHLDKIYKRYLPEKVKFINPIEQMNTKKLETSHKPIEELINHFKSLKLYKSQIQANSVYKIPPKKAIYDYTFFDTVTLHEDLQELLYSKGIKNIYSHQSLGLKSVFEGKHVISTTSTSSGKSLVYQLPILQSLITKSEETSLLLFPTKALSQDQHRSLLSFIGDLNSIDRSLIRTYDGDTTKEDRAEVKRNAKIILTNPDMLHLTMLPNHQTWARFLRNLKYVVIDELHIYKGTFGSNVAYILRRLRRVCELFGNYDIQFISSSATLNDGALHLAKMTGLNDSAKIVWIDEPMNGSPCGEKSIVGWNPDLEYGGGMVSDTAKIILQLLKLNVRTIVFCTVRKTVELVMKEVRFLLKEEDPILLTHIMSYRGGYSVADRRKIEQQMFNGSLTCIVATNALEVGIDIGGLDVVLMCGFPVSLSGFEQEMGRAGRRGLDSLCLLVAGTDPVSQYYVNKMNELVEKKEWEDLCIDLKNLLIAEGQLQCAFKEKNVANDDLGNEWVHWWNCLPWDIYENLIRDKLRWDNDYQKWTCSDIYLPHPPMLVSIRSIDDDSFAVVDVTGGNGRQEVIETIEMNRTTFTLYEGGIFIHQGLPYLIKDFNVDEKYALVERVNVDWTTNQRDYTDIDPALIERIRELHEVHLPIYYGNIVKTSIVFGFFKVDKYGKILDAVEVNNPPVKYKSKGVWIDFPRELITMLTSHKLNLAGAIHAAQHGLMNVLPRFVTIGSYDEVACECKAPEKEFAKTETSRKRPARLILIDNKGGRTGNGLSARVFDCAELIIEETLRIVEECTCSFGCPLCCAGMQCTENSLVLSKDGCRVVLRYLCNWPDPLKGIPFGPEPNMPDISIETVVPVNAFVSSDAINGVKMSKCVEIEEEEKVEVNKEVLEVSEGNS